MAEVAPSHWANRLIGENSPYLLQHAHNPVDWYPWGAEAFGRARAENKPVFLSIGYAACHWCHVMAHESFEDEAVAAYLNQHFISIKVDREERPDIDAIYMQALQLMSGQGGWPMSMFLTPEGKPFFGGTYFPPEDRFGRPGFMWLLRQIVAAWQDQAQEIADSGAAIIDAVVREPTAAPVGREPPAPGAAEELVSRALVELAREYDPAWGGFGAAPKFPMPMALDLLLRLFARTKNLEYLHMVENTLDKMSRGGIYDHVGGGFHRYSIDREWLVPHFEKTLCDNALLAPLYLDLYRLDGDKRRLRVGADTLDWALREMTDPAGGFYATLDADSGGAEGAFYVWKSWEIDAALGPEDAALFKEYYDVGEIGNWADRRGANILNVRVPLEHFAPMKQIDPDEMSGRLDGMLTKLRAARDRRPRPARDDQVIVAWNGLMISALAHGTQVTGNQAYARAARAAADFILRHVRGGNGELLHVWREGRASFNALLDDYAFLILGLIDLYETTFDPALIDEARLLAEEMIARFHDSMRDGFFATDGRDPTVIARIKEFHDGSMPSGNAAAAMALMRLGVHMRCEDWLELARRTINAAGPRLAEYPLGHVGLLAAVAFDIAPPCEIAIAGDLEDPATRDLIDAAWKRYVPARVLAAGPEGSVELLVGRKPVQGRPTAHVCRAQTCGEPAHTRKELLNQL